MDLVKIPSSMWSFVCDVSSWNPETREWPKYFFLYCFVGKLWEKFLYLWALSSQDLSAQFSNMTLTSLYLPANKHRWYVRGGSRICQVSSKANWGTSFSWKLSIWCLRDRYRIIILVLQYYFHSNSIISYPFSPLNWTIWCQKATYDMIGINIWF